MNFKELKRKYAQKKRMTISISIVTLFSFSLAYISIQRGFILIFPMHAHNVLWSNSPYYSFLFPYPFLNNFNSFHYSIFIYAYEYFIFPTLSPFTHTPTIRILCNLWAKEWLKKHRQATNWLFLPRASGYSPTYIKLVNHYIQ
jgi:hypothetical protein